jgi:hypothetical protein
LNRLQDTSTKCRVILFPKIVNEFSRGNSEMQINCIECEGRAIIRGSNKLHIKMSQLYCICKNPHCGHTFVMDLSFSHTLSPSANQARDVVVSMLRALPEAERQLLIANL